MRPLSTLTLTPPSLPSFLAALVVGEVTSLPSCDLESSSAIIFSNVLDTLFVLPTLLAPLLLALKAGLLLLLLMAVRVLLLLLVVEVVTIRRLTEDEVSSVTSPDRVLLPTGSLTLEISQLWQLFFSSLSIANSFSPLDFSIPSDAEPSFSSPSSLLNV